MRCAARGEVRAFLRLARTSALKSRAPSPPCGLRQPPRHADTALIELSCVVRVLGRLTRRSSWAESSGLLTQVARQLEWGLDQGFHRGPTRLARTCSLGCGRTGTRLEHRMSIPSIDPAGIEFPATFSVDISAYLPDPMTEPTG